MKQIKNYALFEEKVLGKGGFSTVYAGYDINRANEVAIKVEKEGEWLKKEFNVLRLLWKKYKESDYRKIGHFGLPIIYDYFEEDGTKYMVMKRYKYSLLDIMRKTNMNYDLTSINNICNQLIYFLKFIHSVGYVHRDLKPDNIMITEDYKKVIIIDFGLTEQLSEINDTNPVGSIRFMSPNIHFYKKYSKRDDLVSLAYSLIYLYKGILPWQGIQGKNRKDKFEKVGKMKLSIDKNELCKGCPEFITKLIHSG